MFASLSHLYKHTDFTSVTLCWGPKSGIIRRFVPTDMLTMSSNYVQSVSISEYQTAQFCGMKMELNVRVICVKSRHALEAQHCCCILGALKLCCTLHRWKLMIWESRSRTRACVCVSHATERRSINNEAQSHYYTQHCQNDTQRVYHWE